MEFFEKAGFSSLWLLINSSRGLPPPSWNLSVILDLSSLDLPRNCWLNAPQVPFHAGFSQILPLPETARAGSIPGSHFHLVFSEQATRTRLYLDISSKSWGSRE